MRPLLEVEMFATEKQKHHCTKGHEWEDEIGQVTQITILDSAPLCLRCLAERMVKICGEVKDGPLPLTGPAYETPDEELDDILRQLHSNVNIITPSFAPLDLDPTPVPLYRPIKG